MRLGLCGRDFTHLLTPVRFAVVGLVAQQCPLSGVLGRPGSHSAPLSRSGWAPISLGSDIIQTHPQEKDTVVTICVAREVGLGEGEGAAQA